jgi:hypothetical protein
MYTEPLKTSITYHILTGNLVYIEVDLKVWQCSQYPQYQSKEICANTDLGRKDRLSFH